MGLDDLAFYGLNPQNTFTTFEVKTASQAQVLKKLKLIAIQSAEMINQNGALRYGGLVNLCGNDNVSKNHLVEAFTQKVIEVMDQTRNDLRERLAVIRNHRSLETLGLVAVNPTKPDIFTAENLFNELDNAQDVDLEDKVHLIVALQRAKIGRKLFLTTTNFPLLELFESVSNQIPQIGIYEYPMNLED